MLHLSDVQEFVERGRALRQKNKNRLRAGFSVFFAGLILLALPFVLVAPPTKLYTPQINPTSVEWYSESALINQFAIQNNGIIWGTGDDGHVYQIHENGITQYSPRDFAPGSDYDHSLRAISSVYSTAIIATADYYAMFEQETWLVIPHGTDPPGNIIESALTGEGIILLDDTGHLTTTTESVPVHDFLGLDNPAPPYSMTQASEGNLWISTTDTLWQETGNGWSPAHTFDVNNVRLLNSTEDYVWLAAEASKQVIAVPRNYDAQPLYIPFDELQLSPDSRIGHVREVQNRLYILSSGGVAVSREHENPAFLKWSAEPSMQINDDTAIYDLAKLENNYYAVGHPRNDYGNRYSETSTTGYLALSAALPLILGWIIFGVLYFIFARSSSDISQEDINARMNALFPGQSPDRAETEPVSSEEDKPKVKPDPPEKKTTSPKTMLLLIVFNMGLALSLGISLPVVLAGVFLITLLIYTATFIIEYRRADDDGKKAVLRNYRSVVIPFILILGAGFSPLAAIAVVVYIHTDSIILACIILTAGVPLFWILIQGAYFRLNTLPLFKGNINKLPDNYMRAVELGEFEKAEPDIRYDLKTLNNFNVDLTVQLLRHLSRCVGARGDQESEQRYLVIALDTKPDDFSSYLTLSEYHLIHGDPQIALALIEAAKEFQPTFRFYDVQYYYIKSEIHLILQAVYAATLAANERYTEANAIIKESLQEANPTYRALYVTVLQMAAYVLYQQGQLERAQAYLKQLVTMYPPGKNWTDVKHLWQQIETAS